MKDYIIYIITKGLFLIILFAALMFYVYSMSFSLPTRAEFKIEDMSK